MIGNLFKLRWWDAYLGHGRFMETGLVSVKYMYAGMFLMSWIGNTRPVIVAFSDVNLNPICLSVPFFAAASISLAGLILNGMGYEFSKWFRVAGATVGMSIWIFIVLSNVSLGVPLAGIMPWMVLGIGASLWIIRRGIMGLPRPGVLGQV